MIIEEIALSKLRKTKLLKRKHSKDQLERCIHSIEIYGQYAPLVVSVNEILCGTLVYDALKKIKMRRAKIIQLGELSEDKKKELRYLDNRTFEMSFWKDEDLKIHLMSLTKEELWNVGFSEIEVDNLINGFINDGKNEKKKVLKELNDQSDVWYCPNCGWTGKLVIKDEN